MRRNAFVIAVLAAGGLAGFYLATGFADRHSDSLIGRVSLTGRRANAVCGRPGGCALPADDVFPEPIVVTPPAPETVQGSVDMLAGTVCGAGGRCCPQRAETCDEGNAPETDRSHTFKVRISLPFPTFYRTPTCWEFQLKLRCPVEGCAPAAPGCGDANPGCLPPAAAQGGLGGPIGGIIGGCLPPAAAQREGEDRSIILVGLWRKVFGPVDRQREERKACPLRQGNPPDCEEAPSIHEQYPGCPPVPARPPAKEPAPTGSKGGEGTTAAGKPVQHTARKFAFPSDGPDDRRPAQGIDTMEFRPSDLGEAESGHKPIQ